MICQECFAVLPFAGFTHTYKDCCVFIRGNLESQLATAKAEIETLKEQLQLANTDNFETEGRCFEWEQRNKRIREALDEYGNHTDACAIGYFQAGEPTPDGGYRQMISGKWYQTKPIDETPKCDCGLKAALDGGKA